MLANSEVKEILDEPYIDAELSPNVTGVLGKEVRLACHVEHLGNKTVSEAEFSITKNKFTLMPSCFRGVVVITSV